MEKIKNFLLFIKNLDKSIKDLIEKMGFPYPFMIHIDRTKNIEEEINKLLKEIEKEIPETFGSSIPYIIGELVDNIEQHSNYSNAFIFLRYDTEEKQLEIGVFDDGLTIPLVFEKNDIQFSKDSEAIKMALEGTTTKKEDITRGFGLITTSSIVKALNSNMQIISRKGILDMQNSKIDINDFEKEFSGTLIYI